MIYRYTGGVPRLVNTLCDTAMLAAFGQDRDHVLLEDINDFSARNCAGRSRRPGPASPDTSRRPWARNAGSPTPIASARDGQHATRWSTRRAEGAAEPVGRVILATEGRTTQELPLKVGRLIIGRTADNDLQVDSRFVSRHHCQIITGAEGSVIEDLNSTNGIFVQGKRVRRYNLNDGDVVVIGKHEIMYVDERLARARLDVHRTASAGVPTLDKPVDRPVLAHREPVAGSGALAPANSAGQAMSLESCGGRSSERARLGGRAAAPPHPAHPARRTGRAAADSRVAAAAPPRPPAAPAIPAGPGPGSAPRRSGK